MSQINDNIVAVVGPHISDGMAVHYGKTASESLDDAERRWLIENGATSAQINDMWFEVLRGAGYEGHLQDMLISFWLGGGLFSGVNLIQNPDFDDATIWVLSGGWSIATGVAHNDGAVGNLTQTVL